MNRAAGVAGRTHNGGILQRRKIRLRVARLRRWRAKSPKAPWASRSAPWGVDLYSPRCRLIAALTLPFFESSARADTIGDALGNNRRFKRRGSLFTARRPEDDAAGRKE